MITVIDGLNRHEYPEILRQMHHLRARTFSDRLGWEVEVKNGLEIDIFDTLDPAYLVATNDSGQVVGSTRFLQTTGPNMLADVFSVLLDGEPAPRSARTWEATRFCVDSDILSARRGANSISRVTSELLLGTFEYAMDAGILDIVAVVDMMMLRVLRWSANAPSDYLGPPKQMGKVEAVAVAFDCTQERIDRIRAHSGIDYDVFAPLPQPAASRAMMHAA